MKNNELLRCLNCLGEGKISNILYRSNGDIKTFIEICPECNGTGIIKNVIKNIENIRAMNDHELANFIDDIYSTGYDDGHDDGWLYGCGFESNDLQKSYISDINKIKEWLNSPVEEN